MLVSVLFLHNNIVVDVYSGWSSYGVNIAITAL